MATTLQSIVNDARILLHDVDGSRWTDAEFLIWGNAGRRDMATLRPTLWGQLAKRTVTLAAGCYQTLPQLGVDDAFSLVDVMNNVGVAGPSGVVRNIARTQLDNFRPNWKSETGTAVLNWFRDEGNHLAFWVYPAVEGGLLDINVSVTPNDLTSLTQQAVPLDVMATTLLNYIMYRAYAKDAEVAQNATLSASYLQLFTAAAAASA